MADEEPFDDCNGGGPGFEVCADVAVCEQAIAPNQFLPALDSRVCDGSEASSFVEPLGAKAEMCSPASSVDLETCPPDSRKESSEMCVPEVSRRQAAARRCGGVECCYCASTGVQEEMMGRRPETPVEVEHDDVSVSCSTGSADSLAAVGDSETKASISVIEAPHLSGDAGGGSELSYEGSPPRSGRVDGIGFRSDVVTTSDADSCDGPRPSCDGGFIDLPVLESVVGSAMVLGTNDHTGAFPLGACGFDHEASCEEGDGMLFLTLLVVIRHPVMGSG